MTTPRDLLLAYQRTWVDDPSRFKMGCWSRQTGKSFSTAYETVTDSLFRKTMWVTLSAGERQALEWMMKAREWAEACKFALEDYQEVRDSAEALLKSAEIRWPNGSRLLALPANPATARGYAANLTLDEFAFHENPDAIWRAIYPSISNPLRGQYRIRIVSTPNGRNNKFFDLWSKPNKWAKHLVDIHAAVAGGLPVDIAELKEGLDDPEGWAQEYECQFLDGAAVLLPYELIAPCESPEATEACAREFFEHVVGGPLFLGIDFGRKKDLTVAWVLQRVGDVLWTRAVIVLEKMSTPDQVEILNPIIRVCQRTCLDYTGPGIGMGDYITKTWKEFNPAKHLFGKVELCTFTPALKVEIFSKLRMAFEGLKLRVPVSRAVREDLHAVQRIVTANGTVTYRAPHTDDGHSDRATGLALAVRAGSAPGAVGTFKRFSGGRGARARSRRWERSLAA